MDFGLDMNWSTGYLITTKHSGQNMSGYDLSLRHPIDYAVPLYGFLSPIVIVITCITNIIVLIVLLKKHMRTPTNIILAGMAFSDMLTGLFPFPVMIYFFGLGHYKDYVPYNWCHAVLYLFQYIPTIFHTASIWLTMSLAIQRYIQNFHSMRAKMWCTIPKTIGLIAVIYLVAFLSQTTRFFDKNIQPIELPSKLNPNATVFGCHFVFKTWLIENMETYYNVYFWFRVLVIQLIPCTLLIVFNAFLVSTLRSAKRLQKQLSKGNKQSNSSDNKTLMLAIVVGVFLLVELPSGILMAVVRINNTWNLRIIEGETIVMVSIFINFFIILTYPINFFIYCGMSRQFRETFKRLFTKTTTVI